MHADVRATPIDDSDGSYLIAQYVDISDRKRFEGQLRRLADTDALTGLYNRRRFGEELEWIVGYAQRYGDPAALLTVDVDHFQYINDSYGHATGDELLGTVTALLRSRAARHRHRRAPRRRRVRHDPAADRARGRGGDRARRCSRPSREQVSRRPRRRAGCAPRSRSASARSSPRRELTAAELLAEAEIALQRRQGARARSLRGLRRRRLRRRRARARSRWVERHARRARARRLRALRAADPRPRHAASSTAPSC